MLTLTLSLHKVSFHSKEITCLQYFLFYQIYELGEVASCAKFKCTLPFTFWITTVRISVKKDCFLAMCTHNTNAILQCFELVFLFYEMFLFFSTGSSVAFKKGLLMVVLWNNPLTFVKINTDEVLILTPQLDQLS